MLIVVIYFCCMSMFASKVIYLTKNNTIAKVNTGYLILLAIGVIGLIFHAYFLAAIVLLIEIFIRFLKIFQTKEGKFSVFVNTLNFIFAFVCFMIVTIR